MKPTKQLNHCLLTLRKKEKKRIETQTTERYGCATFDKLSLHYITSLHRDRQDIQTDRQIDIGWVQIVKQVYIKVINVNFIIEDFKNEKLTRIKLETTIL